MHLVYLFNHMIPHVFAEIPRKKLIYTLRNQEEDKE